MQHLGSSEEALNSDDWLGLDSGDTLLPASKTKSASGRESPAAAAPMVKTGGENARNSSKNDWLGLGEDDPQKAADLGNIAGANPKPTERQESTHPTCERNCNLCFHVFMFD